MREEFKNLCSCCLHLISKASSKKHHKFWQRHYRPMKIMWLWRDLNSHLRDNLVSAALPVIALPVIYHVICNFWLSCYLFRKLVRHFTCWAAELLSYWAIELPNYFPEGVNSNLVQVTCLSRAYKDRVRIHIIMMLFTEWSNGHIGDFRVQQVCWLNIVHYTIYFMSNVFDIITWKHARLSLENMISKFLDYLGVFKPIVSCMYCNSV